MELTKHQIEIVENRLKSLGISYQPLMEDLIDHICCQIETSISEKESSFEEALEQAFSAFEENEILQIQSKTLLLINQKYIAMKKIMLVTALCLLVGFSIVWAQTKPLQFTSPMGNTEIVSHFGNRYHPVKKKNQMHKGIDYKAAIGTPILSVEDGTVLEVKTHDRGYGKHIIIKHEGDYTSMYAHLSEFCVEKGQKIKKGTLIGKVGTTGQSISPHLHLEIRENGKPIDPVSVLKM